MIEYFFKYEIDHNQAYFIEECAKHGCYANIQLIENLCIYYKTDKLLTYSKHVENNPFIPPCIQKHVLNIFCKAIQKKNVLTSMFVRYVRKRRTSYVTTDLALNPLSETNPKYLIDIMHDYKKYTFKLFDLANIIFNSLTNSDALNIMTCFADVTMLLFLILAQRVRVISGGSFKSSPSCALFTALITEFA